MTEVWKRGLNCGISVSSTKNKFVFSDGVRFIFRRRKLSYLLQVILQQKRTYKRTIITANWRAFFTDTLEKLAVP